MKIDPTKITGLEKLDTAAKPESSTKTINLTERLQLNSLSNKTDENQAVEVNIEDESVTENKNAANNNNDQSKEDARDPQTAYGYYDTPWCNPSLGCYGTRRTYIWKDGHKEIYEAQPDGSFERVEGKKLSNVDFKISAKQLYQIKNMPQENVSEDKDTRDPQTAYGYYDTPWCNPSLGCYGTRRTYIWEDGHKEIYEAQPDGSFERVEGKKLSNVELEYIGNKTDNKE